MGHEGSVNKRGNWINFLILTSSLSMLFCPNCANLLVISSDTGYNKWACNTCPYEFPISKQVRQL
jgi:hypothetical protein